MIKIVMHGFLSGTYSSSYRGEDRSLLETELNLCGELLLSRAIKFNKFIILKYSHHQLPQSLCSLKGCQRTRNAYLRSPW